MSHPIVNKRRTTDAGRLIRNRALVRPIRNWFGNAMNKELGPIRTNGHNPYQYLTRGSPRLEEWGRYVYRPLVGGGYVGIPHAELRKKVDGETGHLVLIEAGYPNYCKPRELPH